MRRFLVGGLAVGLMAVSVLAWAAPAMARVGAQSTSCSMNATARFKPGLDLSQEQKEKIKAMGRLTDCVGGGVTSAKLHGMGRGSISCTSGIAKVKLKAHWNTGELSKVTLYVDLGLQSLSGTVTSGKFAGEDLTATDVVLAAVNGDCLTAPLTKAKVTATISL